MTEQGGKPSELARRMRRVFTGTFCGMGNHVDMSRRALKQADRELSSAGVFVEAEEMERMTERLRLYHKVKGCIEPFRSPMVPACCPTGLLLFNLPRAAQSEGGPTK